MQKRALKAHQLAQPRQPVIKDPERYKTVPCANGWYNPTNCRYGDDCQFAHWKGEMRSRRQVQTRSTSSPLPRLATPPPSPKPDGEQQVVSSTLPPPPPSPNYELSPTSVTTTTYEHVVRVFTTPISVYPAITPTLADDDNETLDFLCFALTNSCVECEE